MSVVMWFLAAWVVSSCAFVGGVMFGRRIEGNRSAAREALERTRVGLIREALLRSAWSSGVAGDQVLMPKNAKQLLERILEVKLPPPPPAALTARDFANEVRRWHMARYKPGKSH